METDDPNSQLFWSELRAGSDAGGFAPKEKRFIVAIDFGTTFSSVSFLALPRDAKSSDLSNAYIYLNKIQTIINYSGEPMRSGYLPRRKEVPTEIWYPKKAYLDPLLLRSRARPIDVINIDDSDDEQQQNRGEDLNEDLDMELDEDDEEDNGTLWGYQIQRKLEFADSNRNQNRCMARFKLLLDESDLTQKIREDLEPYCQELKRDRIIKEKEDIIADYLHYLFVHTKNELIKHHEFTETSPVEFVLCVPPIWTPKASRIMQKNMERAMRESGLGRVENDSVDNLFIVSEPEAAAAYMLASESTSVIVSCMFLAIFNIDNIYIHRPERHSFSLMLVVVLSIP